jgi:hypothetical protein
MRPRRLGLVAGPPAVAQPLQQRRQRRQQVAGLGHLVGSQLDRQAGRRGVRRRGAQAAPPSAAGANPFSFIQTSITTRGHRRRPLMHVGAGSTPLSPHRLMVSGLTPRSLARSLGQYHAEGPSR